MRKISNYFMVIASLVSLVGGPLTMKVMADGNETLGPPSITIADGSGFVAAGTGMVTQPGTINIDVPTDAYIMQVLLYWEGRGSADNTVTLNGTLTVTGTEIGFADLNTDSTVFRADITSLNLVLPGANTLTVEDMDFGFRNSGAGILVIIQVEGFESDIQIRDGDDFAYINASVNTPQSQETIPQTFTFDAVDYDRTAKLTLFVGNAEPNRPDAIEITVGGYTTEYTNLLAGADGPEWDTFTADIDILSGENMLTVQLFSRDDENGLTGDPDSIAWVLAALSVSTPVRGDEGCTPGYWKQAHHFDSWDGYTQSEEFDAVFGVDPFTVRLRRRQTAYDPTLLEALKARGGGINALARHCVAALLNASNPDVEFFYTEAEVLQACQDAITSNELESTKDDLEEANESFCPLD